MTPLISAKNLSKSFERKKQTLKAVEDFSLDIYPGETIGLVGESGCGKSTVGKLLLRLEEATRGTVHYDGQNIFDFNTPELKQFRQKAQIIFQDPFASLNPRMTAKDIISEPFDIHRLAKGADKNNKIEELFSLVGLNPSHLSRYPHEFSGGQRQRIGIARALAASPRFIVCDEPISALDVSIQAQIVNLLKKLQEEMGLTYLFIAHDLSMVKYLSDRVAVMYLGHLMELASSEEIYEHPHHPYTQALLSAIPIPDPLIERKRTRIFLHGEIPSPLHPPTGCPFSTRCPQAMDVCRKIKPRWTEVKPGHFSACHLYDVEFGQKLT